MSTRNVSRRGGWRIKPFTDEQKRLCMQLHKQGESTRRIAAILNLNFKRIDEYIRMVKMGRNTTFTPEEVAKLISLYQSGITCVKALHKYFTDKEGWSIRNKILYLKRRGLLMNMVPDKVPTTEIVQTVPTIPAHSVLNTINIHSTTIEAQPTVNLTNDHQNTSTTAESEQPELPANAYNESNMQQTVSTATEAQSAVNTSTMAESEQTELTANACSESDMQQTASTATEAQPVNSYICVMPDQVDNDDLYEHYFSDNNETIFGDPIVVDEYF